MTKEDYTHVSILVDRSGSMQALAEESSNGINSLIKEQSELEGEITVSLYQFDDRYEKVFGPVSATDAPSYVLQARSMTALIDSACKAIDDTGEFLAGLKEEERPSNVLFVIVTDGFENASSEFKLEQLQSRIKTQTENYKWEFMYLGSTPDAFADARSYGIKGTTQVANTAASYSATYSNLSAAMTTNRLSRGATTLAQAMPTNIDEDGNVNQS